MVCYVKQLKKVNSIKKNRKNSGVSIIVRGNEFDVL